MAIVRIYGLVNTFTGQIFYVGQTKSSLRHRLAQVKYEFRQHKDGKRKHLALMGVYAMGGKVGIIELDRASSQEIADSKEVKWIDTLKKLGYAWGNTSAGGPGNHGVKRSLSQRKRISNSMKKYRLSVSSQS